MSAVNANPATLSQFDGTQFMVGGAWAEATYNLSHAGGLLPGLGPFSAKSEAQGTVLGGFGLTQDLEALGLPATFGLGLSAAAGAGLNFVDVPASKGTATTISVLEITSGTAVELTDRLSAGAAVRWARAGWIRPFVGIGSYTYDYALRASSGSIMILATAPMWACITRRGRNSRSTMPFNSNCSTVRTASCKT